MKKSSSKQHPSPYRNALAQEYGSSIEKGIYSTLNKMTKDRPYFWRNCWIILIVILLDLLENVISGYTSYHYIYNHSAGFTEYASILSIAFLVLFEGAKVLVYFKTAVAIFHTDEGIPWAMIAASLLLTAGSVWFSYYGAQDVVHTRTPPPVMTPIDESEKILQEQIASTRSTIKNIEKRSDQSIVYVTNKQVEKLEANIAKYTSQLVTIAAKRKSGDTETLLSHRDTKVYTANIVGRFAICFNLLSLFLFSPIVGNFIIKSQLDFRLRLGGFTPESSQNNVRSIENLPDPLKERSYQGNPRNGKARKIPNGVPVDLPNP